MTPMNRAFQDSCFCAVPSQLSLGRAYNYFNQLNIMEVILCQFWDQPLLGLELSIFLLLETLPLGMFFSESSYHSMKQPKQPCEESLNGRRLSPLPTALAEFQQSLQMTATIPVPGLTPQGIAQTTRMVVEEWIIVFYCFWASRFWDGLLCNNTALKCKDSLISAAQRHHVLSSSCWRTVSGIIDSGARK